MAIQFGSAPPSSADTKTRDAILGVNDLRTLKFFVHYLRSTIELAPFNYSVTDDKATIKSALNAYLAATNMDRSYLNSRLMAEAENNILPLNQFDWLKENQDACCAIWGHLSSAPIRIFPGSLLGHSNPESSLYRLHNIPSSPTSHWERYELIKAYFDSWIIHKASNLKKSQFMEQLKITWLYFQKEVAPFQWLLTPERDACEWAWKYLEEYDRKEYADSRPGIRELNIFQFSPINVGERYLAIYAVLRLWTCHRAEKTLLIKNMNKAWRQRQLRRERDDKKAINSYVDVKVKKRLDLLARYNRCQINEVLSDLINKEYARLKEEIDGQFNS